MAKFICPNVNVVPSRVLWAMKRRQQKRDLEMVERGENLPEGYFLIKPELARSARITWPKVSLLDKAHRATRPSTSSGGKKRASGARKKK
jgi:hypothetical protein